MPVMPSNSMGIEEAPALGALLVLSLYTSFSGYSFDSFTIELEIVSKAVSVSHYNKLLKLSGGDGGKPQLCSQIGTEIWVPWGPLLVTEHEVRALFWD